MKKVILSVIAILVLAVIVGAVVFLNSLNGIIKRAIETHGPQIAKVSIRLDGVSCSPFSGQGEIRGLVVGNPEGFKAPSAIQVARISVSLIPSSIRGNVIHVNEILIEAPEITWEGKRDANNLRKIQQNVEGSSSGEGQPSRKMQVDRFKITGGKANVTLAFLGGKSLTVPLGDIELKDIGKGTGGVTPKELAQIVAKAVTERATASVSKAVAKLGTNAIENFEKTDGGVSGEVGKVLNTIKNLFK